MRGTHYDWKKSKIFWRRCENFTAKSLTALRLYQVNEIKAACTIKNQPCEIKLQKKKGFSTKVEKAKFVLSLGTKNIKLYCGHIHIRKSAKIISFFKKKKI